MHDLLTRQSNSKPRRGSARMLPSASITPICTTTRAKKERWAAWAIRPAHTPLLRAVANSQAGLSQRTAGRNAGLSLFHPC